MFSLIMATVGRIQDVGVMIESLQKQSEPNFELIIVDQNIDDRLQPYVDAALVNGLQVQHARLLPPSLSGARNLGLSMAKGDLIAFPDDDCWYEPNVLSIVKQTFDASPDVGGVVIRWIEQQQAQPKKMLTDLHLNEWRNFKGGHASSISLFFRKNSFEQVGGFDTHFGVGQWFGAGEETDLVLRMLTANVRMVYQDQAVVHHHCGEYPFKSLNDMAKSSRMRARGTGALYAKHQLSFFTVLRGLLSPLLRAILNCNSRKQVMKHTSVLLGRFEGFIRWHQLKK